MIKTATLSSILIFVFSALNDDLHPIPTDTVKDIENNQYQTVLINYQEWMTTNLRVTMYNDGTKITNSDNNNASAGSFTSEGAYFIYSNIDVDSVNSETEIIEMYGALYNWYAVNDPRGICPEGWRIPSDADWTRLAAHLISQYDVVTANNLGNMLKSCRQSGSHKEGDCNTDIHPRWDHPDRWIGEKQFGTDKFGFTALPGGYRNTDGTFAGLGTIGFWWTSNDYSDVYAWHRSIDLAGSNIGRSYADKALGFSVRCIKDI